MALAVVGCDHSRNEGARFLAEKLESVSAFFPAFNDAATIGGLVEKTFRILESSGRDFEIIVVDDGSSDPTPQILQQLESRYGNVFRVIRHPYNRGYGAALRSGFSAATKEVVFYTDGDGQYDPGELRLLLGRLQPQIGLVNGYKIKRQDPRYRIYLGEIYNALARKLFRITVRDVDCDFRLIRRALLAKTCLRSESGAICVELIQQLENLGCGVVEVPVHHYARPAGRSQFFRWRAVLATLRQLVCLYFHRPASIAVSQEDLSETSAK